MTAASRYADPWPLIADPQSGGLWKESTYRRSSAAVQEYVSTEQAKSEPAYKAELEEERKRREQLERRVNELVAENKRSRQVAEEAERSSAVRSELQRLGVAKIDLAYKAVQDGIVRTEDGRLVARSEGRRAADEGVSGGVRERESGVSAGAHTGGNGNDRERESLGDGAGTGGHWTGSGPGMSAEEMQRVREEIVRVASQTLRGL